MLTRSRYVHLNPVRGVRMGLVESRPRAETRTDSGGAVIAFVLAFPRNSLSIVLQAFCGEAVVWRY